MNYKTIILSAILVTTLSTAYADPPLPDEGELIELNVYNDDNHDNGGLIRPRGPINIPCVYINGNVLTFDAALEGCTVQLLDEDETVVFSDFIEEYQTSLVLPSTLSGMYELQIVCGDIMFYAFIEL